MKPEEKAIYKEATRLDEIQAKIKMLNHLSVKAIDTSMSFYDQKKALLYLEGFEIKSIDFQERTHEAEWLKEDAIKAAKIALENRKTIEIEAVLDIAHIDNFNFDHAAALADHEEFKTSLQAEIDQSRADAVTRWEQTEAARKAKEERLKLIGPDKLILQAIADSLDEVISGFDIPVLNTDEANALARDLIADIKSNIHEFEQRGKDLK